MRWYSF